MVNGTPNSGYMDFGYMGFRLYAFLAGPERNGLDFGYMYC